MSNKRLYLGDKLNAGWKTSLKYAKLFSYDEAIDLLTNKIIPYVNYSIEDYEIQRVDTVDKTKFISFEINLDRTFVFLEL